MTLDRSNIYPQSSFSVLKPASATRKLQNPLLRNSSKFLIPNQKLDKPISKLSQFSFNQKSLLKQSQSLNQSNLKTSFTATSLLPTTHILTKPFSNITQDKPEAEEVVTQNDRLYAWKERFKTLTFYFDGVESDMLNRLSDQIKKLGGNVDRFLNLGITHIITSNPDAHVLDNKDPNAISNKIPDILIIARKLDLKLWTISKLRKVLETLLISQMPPQGQGLTDRNALQQALQNERIFGVSTHRSHSSNLKSFKGPYLLVEEPSGTYKPIAIKEYTTPEDLDNPPWPMIHFGTHSPYTAFAIGSGNDDTEHSSDPVENQENVNPLGENSNASGLISGSIVSIFSRTASENPSLRGLTNREINPNILQRVVDTTSMNKRLRGNEVEERPAKRQKSGKPQVTALVHSKPGFCENCCSKYDDYNLHVSGKRHRKFAMNQTNFLQLDRFLSKVERQPIKEQISHQVLQRVDSNIMDNDLTLINLVQSETTPTKSNNVKQDLTPNDILPRHESFFPADQKENQKPLLSPSIEPRVSEKVEVCEMIDDSVEYLGSKLHSLADVCVKVNPTIEIQSALTSFAKNHELEENTLNSKQSLLEAVKRDLKSTINTELNLETVAKDETILELYQQVIDVVVADEINRVLETKTVELSADIIEQARKHILDELMMKEWNEKLKQIIMEQLNDFVLATSRDIANRQEANVKDEVELISLTTPRQSRKMSIESPTKTRNNYRDISRPKKPFSPKPFVKSMGNNRHRLRYKSTYNGSTIEEERKGDIRDQQVIKGLRDNRGIPVVQSVSRKIVP